jgi:alkaline phosphatase
MGVAQEQAAQFYLGRPLSWQDAPYKATINTQSTSAVTDSAASGTAMSTGVLVDNDVVSVFIPGNGTDIRTSLEFYKNVQNKRVGMVTSTYIVHATPATFGAHEASRNNFQQIYNDYLVSKPHLIMGGGRPEVNLAAATTAGYRTATTKTQMNAFLPTDPLGM